MIRIQKAFLLAILTLCIAANASADTITDNQITLNGGVKDFKGYTQGLSGDITVTGMNFITNGTLLLHPGTKMTFTDNASLVFVNYGSGGRKAGQLIALGGVNALNGNTITINVEDSNQAGSLIFLGRDAVQTIETNLCVEEFMPECAEYFDYFNYGSLNPTDYKNDSCGILNNVIINGWVRRSSDIYASSIILAGCGRGTILNNVRINESRGDGVKLFGGDVTLYDVNAYKSAKTGIDWNADYQGWLVKPISQFSGRTNYEGNNPSTPYGPVICSDQLISVGPVTDYNDLILNSGDLFINNKNLFFSPGGDAVNNIFLTLPENLPFGTGCIVDV